MNARGVRAQNEISRALRTTTALTMAQHDRQDARLPPVLNAMQAYVGELALEMRLCVQRIVVVRWALRLCAGLPCASCAPPGRWLAPAKQDSSYGLVAEWWTRC